MTELEVNKSEVLLCCEDVSLGFIANELPEKQKILLESRKDSTYQGHKITNAEQNILKRKCIGI